MADQLGPKFEDLLHACHINCPRPTLWRMWKAQDDEVRETWRTALLLATTEIGNARPGTPRVSLLAWIFSRGHFTAAKFIMDVCEIKKIDEAQDVPMAAFEDMAAKASSFELDPRHEFKEGAKKYTNRDTISLLTLAIACARYDEDHDNMCMVTLLLFRGADPNRFGSGMKNHPIVRACLRPLDLACILGLVPIALVLLTNDATCANLEDPQLDCKGYYSDRIITRFPTALVAACKLRDVVASCKLVGGLLAAGANPNVMDAVHFTTPLLAALVPGRERTIRHNWDFRLGPLKWNDTQVGIKEHDCYDDTCKPNYEVITLLLADKVSPSDGGGNMAPPIHFAALNMDLESIERLVKAGADIQDTFHLIEEGEGGDEGFQDDFKDVDFEYLDYSNRTPLEMVLSMNHPFDALPKEEFDRLKLTTQKLLEHGAELRPNDWDMVELLFAGNDPPVGPREKEIYALLSAAE